VESVPVNFVEPFMLLQFFGAILKAQSIGGLSLEAFVDEICRFGRPLCG